MKVVEWVLEKLLHRMAAINEMKFGLMPENGTIVDMFFEKFARVLC